MNIWKGHILAGVAVVFGLVAVASFYAYFGTLRSQQSEVLTFLVFILGCIGFIGGLTSAALSYAEWVPKWERDERRTGKVPGERRTQ